MQFVSGQLIYDRISVHGKMGKVIDMTGQKFGRLTVIERDFNTNTNHKAYWICQCNCGKIISVRGQDLRQGKTLSCGCYSKEINSIKTTPNMIGQKYGKLTVIERIGSKNNRSLWKCQCDCGKIINVPRDSLIRGNTQSCGCILSQGENIIAKLLDEQGIKYKQQYTFSDLVGKNNTKLRFDFGILDEDETLKYLIEFQGEQHFIPFKNDTEEIFQLRQEYDKRKREYCKQNNIPLIEINYKNRTNLTWENLQFYINTQLSAF